MRGDEEGVNLKCLMSLMLCNRVMSSVNIAVKFGCYGMEDGCFVEQRGGGAVVWQSGTTARHNSESLFSLDFVLPSSPSSSPLACPLSTFFLVLKLIVFYHHKDTWF